MKTLQDKVTEMFLAQHELNCKLHPEWWEQGWNFRLAIQMEAAEASNISAGNGGNSRNRT